MPSPRGWGLGWGGIGSGSSNGFITTDVSWTSFTVFFSPVLGSLNGQGYRVGLGRLFNALHLAEEANGS